MSSHTAPHLREVINKWLEDFQLNNKVFAMVGDNASAQIACANEMIQGEFRLFINVCKNVSEVFLFSEKEIFTNVRCICHTLQLMVNKVLKSVDVNNSQFSSLKGSQC